MHGQRQSGREEEGHREHMRWVVMEVQELIADV